MDRRLALLLVLVLAIGCGGAVPSGGRAEQAPLELGLRRADGTFLEVGDLRGRVVLLFLFATYDGPSQMALTPLREIAAAHEDLAIVGVDVEPSARQLIGTFEQALEPPFPVTYDPEDQLTSGSTVLGAIDTVPTWVVLDSRGVERRRAVGFLDRAALERLLAGAR